MLGAVALGAGYGLSGLAGSIWPFALAQGLLGFGSAATFGPLMTDISHWFVRRRGIAVAIASCGNYLSGVIWPPLIQHFIASHGWRPTQLGVGIICVVAILPLVLAMRRRPPATRCSTCAPAAISKRSRSTGCAPRCNRYGMAPSPRCASILPMARSSMSRRASAGVSGAARTPASRSGRGRGQRNVGSNAPVRAR
jgi:MFS family permease